MLLTQLTNSGSQHQNSSVFPLGSHLFLPLWSWVDAAVWSWEGTSCHRIFGMWRAAVLPCWGHSWKFLKFAVTVILVIYFSVTPHPKTYWLTDDFITGQVVLVILFSRLTGCVFFSIWQKNRSEGSVCLSFHIRFLGWDGGKAGAARTGGIASTMVS